MPVDPRPPQQHVVGMAMTVDDMVLVHHSYWHYSKLKVNVANDDEDVLRSLKPQ